MEFTFTEHNGKLPIDEWLIPALKEFVRNKYGVEMDISIINNKIEESIKPSE